MRVNKQSSPVEFLSQAVQTVPPPATRGGRRECRMFTLPETLTSNENPSKTYLNLRNSPVVPVNADFSQAEGKVCEGITTDDLVQHEH